MTFSYLVYEVFIGTLDKVRMSYLETPTLKNF